MAREAKTMTTSLRAAVIAGQYREAEYLPPIRDISSQYGVSFETARRCLKQLEQEGLLTAEARHGFRVAPQAEALAARQPIAYVSRHALNLNNAQAANWAISQALTLVAAERGRTTLGVHVGGLAEQEIQARLTAMPLSGIVLDTLDDALLKLVQATCRQPLVMVNSWFETADVDVVLQDNYRGGFLAARWLAQAGAQRIAWLGPMSAYCHTRERCAGVAAGLASQRRILLPDAIMDVEGGALEAAARELLARKPRPDGVTVFTKDAARALRAAAAQAELVIGKDLRVIGWTVEDCFESEHAATFAGGPLPPAVVWQARDMAEAAVELLVSGPQARKPGRRVLVPVRIKEA